MDELCSIQVSHNRFYTSVLYCTEITSSVHLYCRTTTVRDMMSDLPKIENGADRDKISYGGEPRSHVQKMFRSVIVMIMIRL